MYNFTDRAIQLEESLGTKKLSNKISCGSRKLKASKGAARTCRRNRAIAMNQDEGKAHWYSQAVFSFSCSFSCHNVL